MKAEIKPKVLGQVLGYKIKQMCDSKKLIKKYAVYAGKNIVNDPKGFDTYEQALELANKINNGDVKANVIKKNGR